MLSFETMYGRREALELPRGAGGVSHHAATEAAGEPAVCRFRRWRGVVPDGWRFSPR
ncbi:MAG TPA: hypothetical protein P5234_01600 [Thermoanaerobaculaceae bacterium]|nr:hypothetical protein [Thermoanaerobaculaceae bacterium]HRS14921.1 hypothetical protein [Thermoanaerobaculaceae bacterium]